MIKCNRQADSTLDPLRAQLAELDQRSVDQEEQIVAVKARIATNDDRVARMLLGSGTH